MGYAILALTQVLITIIFICLWNLYTFGRFSPNVFALVDFIVTWFKELSPTYLNLLICWIVVYIFECFLFSSIVSRFYRSRINSNKYTEGTSHWASRKEMKKVNLLTKREDIPNTNSILLAQSVDAELFEKEADSFVYKKEGKYIVSYNFDVAPFHLLLTSGSRGGKGVGTILSTLLSWKDSILCFDPKAENYEKTAGYRSQFSKIIRIDPMNPFLSHMNLCDLIRIDHLSSDVRNLSSILLPAKPTDSNAYFTDNGRNMIALSIFFVVFFEKVKTLAQAFRVLTSNEASVVLATMAANFKIIHSDNLIMQKTIEKCLYDAQNFLGLVKTPNTLGGIMTTATTALSIFAEPTIDLVTSDSHFDINELMEGDKPVSIYVTVGVDDIETTAPFTRALFSMINRNLMGGEVKKRKRKLLMLIDEFSQLGRFQEIEKTIPIAAGYGICYVLAIQSISTLTSIYGRENAKIFTDNCIISLLKVQDPESSKYFSDMLGSSTVLVKKSSKSGKHEKVLSDGYSVSTTEKRRALMDASEVRSKPGDTVLVMIPSRPPYKGKKLLYYEEKFLKDIANIPYDINEEVAEVCSGNWQDLEKLLGNNFSSQTRVEESSDSVNGWYFNQAMKTYKENPNLYEVEDGILESDDFDDYQDEEQMDSNFDEAEDIL